MEKASNECPICLQEFTEDVLDLKCGHKLHKLCYLALKEAQKTQCPLCLKPLESVQEVPEEKNLPKEQPQMNNELNYEIMSVDEIVENKFGPHYLLILKITGIYDQMIQYYDLFRDFLIENDSFGDVIMEIQQFILLQHQ